MDINDNIYIKDFQVWNDMQRKLLDFKMDFEWTLLIEFQTSY